MLGLASSTWTVVSTGLGLIGVLLLFYYGMPGSIQTGGRATIVGNPTSEAEAEKTGTRRWAIWDSA
jgi:hypothetical protein